MMIKLGIIGTGRIASRAVAEIRVAGGIEISAVLNPNMEHANEFAERHGIDRIFSGTDEFADAIDAAYIASPHGTHYEYAKNLLKKGIHVICEKPMAFEWGKVEELYDIATQNSVVLMEGIKTAHCPGFKKIEEVISGGVIGDVVDVEAAFTRLTPYNCREYNDKRFGGAFTEFGSYTMLPILRFFGTERFNVAFMSSIVNDVDVYTKAVFEYRDRFACAKTGLSVKSEGQLLISGTKGYLLAPSPWWLTKYFEIRYEDPKQIEKYECEFEGDGLRYEFAEFVNCINGGIPAPAHEREEATARAGIYDLFLKDRSERIHL